MMWFETLALHPPPEPLESFTGYLIRLAEQNAIRSKSALSAVVFPHLKRKSTWTDLPRVSYGALPEAANCTTEQLHATTFHHLLNKFQRSVHPATAKVFLMDALAPDLRYCPLCLQESGFYRLTWRFTHLTGCPLHHVDLLDRCGHCKALIPLLPTPLWLGICPTCGGDLRDCQTQSMPDAEQATLQCVSDDLVFLLSAPSWGDGTAPIYAFGPTLRRVRRDRGWSREALADYLGISNDWLNAVEGRRASGRGETFGLYLKYLTMFNLSFRQVFAGEPHDDEQQKEREWVARVNEAAASLKRDGKSVTQEAICTRLHCSSQKLKQYPAVQTRLQELGIRFRQRGIRKTPSANVSTRGLELEEKYLAQVKTIVEQMAVEGIPYSGNKVAHRMGMSGPGLRRYPRIAAFLANCSAVEQAATHAKWCERVEQAVAHLQAHDEPVTQNGVARLLGISKQRLRHHEHLLDYLATFDDYNMERHTRQQQIREVARYEAVTAAIQQIELEGRRVTQMAVAKALHTTVQSLKGYASIRPLMEEIANPAKR